MEVHPSQFSVSRRAFHGIRYLSSEANSDSNDNDGFSDLDNPPESDKVGIDTDKKDSDDSGSESELSHDDSDIDTANDADALACLSEAEGISEGVVKDGEEKPLFRIIMNCSRNFVEKALNKWIEEGNQLGREEVTMTMLNLRKRRLYHKALQVRDLSHP
jgi:hypothetical protein